MEGYHGRHYDILGQWLGTSVTDQPEHVVTVQFGVEGFGEPEPAIAFVLPGLRQVDAALSWDELEEMTRAMLDALERHRPKGEDDQ